MIGLWGWTLRPLLSNFTSSRGADSPSTQSPQVQAWQSELILCRTLYEGWEAVRSRSRELLPQHPKEASSDYTIRLNRPTFYNAFGRTVRSLAGTVFKQPPERVGIPSEIIELYDSDIDLQGTKGDPFCLHAFTDALATGLAGIVVDMPDFAGGTLLEAQQLDVRPFWSLVRKDDIVSFRTDVVNGKTVLGQLVLKDRIEIGSGQFGVEIREQFGVYRRTNEAVTFQAWSAGRSGKLRPDADAKPLRGVTEIPFAPVYTSRDDWMCARPPLLDLANLNLLHYQTNSDLHHAAHIANVPIGVTIGFEGEVEVGPNRWINFPTGTPDAKAFWMETTGASLGSTRAILADIEAQMAALGLGMLQRQTRAAETAEKASLDRKDQDSTLAGIVGDLENGLDMALGFTAQFLGMEFEEGGHLEFTREFVSEPAATQRTENNGAPKDPKDPTKPGATNNPATSGAV